MSETAVRAKISEQAAYWLFLSTKPTMSRAERAQFVDWLRESPVHIEEYFRVSLLHDALAGFDDWARVSTEPTEDDVVTPLRPQASLDLPASLRTRWRTQHAPAFKALVAGAVVAVITVLGLLAWAGLDTRPQIYLTDATERREVTLADGSHLQIAPNTRLRVRLETHRRMIFMDRGRAVFRVAKDAARPFYVEADHTTVRAVGTAFAVDMESDEVMVTVSHGRIAVGPQDEASGNDTTSGGAATAAVAPPVTLMDAGEQAAVRHGKVSALRKVDVARALAWADNRLVLEDDTVAQAARMFNAANEVQLRVVDDALAARRVSGVFDASDPLSFVAFLESDQSAVVSQGRKNELVIRGAAHKVD